MKFCYENYNKSSEMTNGDLLPCKIMFFAKTNLLVFYLFYAANILF